MAVDRDIQLKILSAVHQDPKSLHYLRAVPEEYFSGRERELREKILEGAPLKRSEVIALESANAEWQMAESYAAELIEEGFLHTVRVHLDSSVQAYKEKDTDRLQNLFLFSPTKPALEPPMTAAERFEIEMGKPLKFVYELPDALRPLKNYWGKLMPGAIHVVAADNGVGKSLLLEQLALSFGLRGIPVQDYSVEMPFSNRVFRYLHHMKGAKYDIGKWFDGLIPQEELREVIRELPENLYIHQPRTRHEMMAHAERMHLDRGVNIFFVDYLQALATGTGQTKYEEIAAVAEDIYRFTLRYPTVWITAAQYNRAGKNAQRVDRDGKRAKPANSDLLGANEIETLAWTITHMAREDDYSGERRIYIGKNRFGVLGETTLNFDDEYLVFKG